MLPVIVGLILTAEIDSLSAAEMISFANPSRDRGDKDDE
jgi:hypothetical protein